MRISATQLESFRLFMDPEQSWMSEDDLRATIEGKFVPNRAVMLGSAFGKIVEQPDRYRIVGGYRCGDFSFDDATMAEPLSLIERDGVFEAKAVKSYGPHDVASMADHLRGARLSEFKTTTSTFNFEKYADSCQWRFMVDAFEPLMVTYLVFELDDHENGVVEVKHTNSFNLFPYAELHRDCCLLVDDFVSYVTAKGLDGILRLRQQKAEAA